MPRRGCYPQCNRDVNDSCDVDTMTIPSNDRPTDTEGSMKRNRPPGKPGSRTGASAWASSAWDTWACRWRGPSPNAGSPCWASTSTRRRSPGSSAGESYIGHIPAEVIREMRSHGFEATDRFDRLDEPDAILICVPTPLTETREPDLTYVDQLRPGDRRPAAARPARRPGEHDLPRHHPRRRPADPGGRRPEGLAARTSSWPSAPSARTPATRTSRRRRSPRWSAGSTRPASNWPPRCTAR